MTNLKYRELIGNFAKKIEMLPTQLKKTNYKNWNLQKMFDVVRDNSFETSYGELVQQGVVFEDSLTGTSVQALVGCNGIFLTFNSDKKVPIHYVTERGFYRYHQNAKNDKNTFKKIDLQKVVNSYGAYLRNTAKEN